MWLGQPVRVRGEPYLFENRNFTFGHRDTMGISYALWAARSLLNVFLVV